MKLRNELRVFGSFPDSGLNSPPSLRNENSPQIFALSDNELRKFRFSATTYFSDVTSSEFFALLVSK